MRNHLFQSLGSTLACFPNFGIILMGEFNKLNPGPLISSFDLKQIVKEPTRGTNILDIIYTLISTYYEDVKILPPIPQSDHSTLSVQSSRQSRVHQQPTYSIRRTSKSSNKRTLVNKLSTVNLSHLYRMDSVIDQIAQWISTYLFAKPKTILVMSHG